jgi:UDP-glucose 4-epimerase
VPLGPFSTRAQLLAGERKDVAPSAVANDMGHTAPRLLLVSPVHNEAEHLEPTARALAAQTRRPDRWIVVDDGSTDATLAIARRLEVELDFLEVVEAPPDGPSGPDKLALAREARAFNFGLAGAGWSNYDFIGKLDGDVELPPRWFATLLERFAADPDLGLAGGRLLEAGGDGEWRPIAIPAHHVHGAVKLYSRRCLEAIGGIPERLAWDTIDETYARMRGFETISFTNLEGRHRRPWGSADGRLRGRARHGECAWILQYGSGWVFLRSFKVSRVAPRGLSGAAFLYGYLRAAVRGVPRVDDPEFRRFTRGELRARLLAPPRRLVRALLTGRKKSRPGPLIDREPLATRALQTTTEGRAMAEIHTNQQPVRPHGDPIDGGRMLVTGGAGTIGSTLVDQLIEAGAAEVVVLDNFVRGRRRNLEWAAANGNLTVVEGDIRDRDLVRELSAGIDVVFHQAAIRITQCAEEPRLALEVLVDGTFNVVEAAADAGVPRLVAASSASVYGLAEEFPTTERQHPYANDTLYGASKTFNEGLLRSFHAMRGLDYVGLRYFNVYGPRMDVHGLYTEVLVRWMERIVAGQPPLVFGDGAQTMDFVCVPDIARANLLAARAPVTDKVFNVASGTETSLQGLAEALLRTMGSDLDIEYGPERAVNGVGRRLADTGAAERELGFRAEIDLDEGLRMLVDWWEAERENAAAPVSAAAPVPAEVGP